MRHIGSKEELGQLLAELRREAGYSYRALSEKTGINPGTLEGWQKGTHWPVLDKLAGLLHFYGETVTIGYAPREES
jgi:transcriptional regulator with XRE-family HTH domain